MANGIPTGQFIGSCIEHLLWMAVGAYLAWIRPRRLRRAVLAGKISEEQSQARLKQIPSYFGYIIMVCAITFLLLHDFDLF
jgi:hypothetical protein